MPTFLHNFGCVKRMFKRFISEKLNCVCASCPFPKLRGVNCLNVLYTKKDNTRLPPFSSKNVVPLLCFPFFCFVVYCRPVFLISLALSVMFFFPLIQMSCHCSSWRCAFFLLPSMFLRATRYPTMFWGKREKENNVEEETKKKGKPRRTKRGNTTMTQCA